MNVSNLRSDCRDLLKREPPGSMWAAHVDRLICQIDHIEDMWHAAIQARNAAQKDLLAWNWLAEMCCTVIKNSDAREPWIIADVDGHKIGWGKTPIEGIMNVMGDLEKIKTDAAESCCDCGEPYPRIDLVIHGYIYCRKCRILPENIMRKGKK